MKMKFPFRTIYLDNAATSRFKPRAVLEAAAGELKRSANGGRGSHDDSLKSALTIEECRGKISALTAQRYAIFTKNCTEAVNLALFGMRLSGEVITTVFEHNSVLRPLAELERQGKITIRFIAPDADGIVRADKVGRAVSKDTSLIAMSEISNVTGGRHDIAGISVLAASHGIKLLVDAAQSLGHAETDYSKASFVCASGHKGLLSPQGTGFLATDGKTPLEPLIFGGTGGYGADKIQPRVFPEGYESGTLNTTGIAGLSAGIDFVNSYFSDIAAHVSELTRVAYEELKTIKKVTIYSVKDTPGGILSFNIGDMPSGEAADALNSVYRIEVRGGLHCAPKLHEYYGTAKRGMVRASFGLNNNEKDAEALVRAVSAMAKN